MNRPLRILHIEDNPDDRTLIQRELLRKYADLQVTPVLSATDFARALEEAEAYDLVLTDYHLGWTDGLAILRTVKDRCPDCPVIMVTGTGSEEIAVEAMKAGLDDYVLKAAHHFGRLSVAVRTALESAPRDCVVSDVGSTKRAIVSANEDPRFVGGHPLAGAESSGVEHARPDLFEQATWYLTPRVNTSGVLYERLHRLLRALGARPAAIEPEIHDAILATSSA